MCVPLPGLGCQGGDERVVGPPRAGEGGQPEVELAAECDGLPGMLCGTGVANPPVVECPQLLCASLLLQVSKTAPTGEYLVTGSFMIRGRKNYLPPQVSGEVLGSVVGGQWVTTDAPWGHVRQISLPGGGQMGTRLQPGCNQVASRWQPGGGRVGAGWRPGCNQVATGWQPGGGQRFALCPHGVGGHFSTHDLVTCPTTSPTATGDGLRLHVWAG